MSGEPVRTWTLRGGKHSPARVYSGPAIQYLGPMVEVVAVDDVRAAIDECRNGLAAAWPQETAPLRRFGEGVLDGVAACLGLEGEGPMAADRVEVGQVWRDPDGEEWVVADVGAGGDVELERGRRLRYTTGKTMRERRYRLVEEAHRG